jgi:hypothetical protein
MAGGGLTEEQIERLARDVSAKILARRGLLKHSEGEILIRVFRKGIGFDVKVTLTS